MGSPFTMKKRLVEAAASLHSQGLAPGSAGNLSVRLDDDRILITPTGLSLGGLDPAGLVIVDLRGKHLQGTLSASSELAMHLSVYQMRPDVTGVVHAHPTYATAFAVAGMELASDVLPEAVVSVGDIPLTDYAAPGTDEVPKSIAPFIENHQAVLLRNHGLLTVGRTLVEACHRHETVEHLARVSWLARQLGKMDRIPTEDFERLQNIRDKVDRAWKQNQRE
jgi:L-fuculose-phosphate aldolase